MTQLDVQEAGNRLADLIARVRAGEEVIISEHGKAVATLISAEDPDRRAALGMSRGKIWMTADCFDPMTDEELKEWGL